MGELKITPVKKADHVCSCNVCNAKNYEGPYSGLYSEGIFEVQIGQTVVGLCPGCLHDFTVMAKNALKQAPRQTFYAIVSDSFHPGYRIVEVYRDSVDKDGNIYYAEKDRPSSFETMLWKFSPQDAEKCVFADRAKANEILTKLQSGEIEL